MANAKRLRVLCLHGFRTSGDILRRQVELARWGEAVMDLMDLSFLDAPYPAKGSSNVEGKFPPPYYEWFSTNPEFTEFYGVEDSVSYIADYVKLHGPFDGLLGFSQGGYLVGALAGMQRQNNLLPFSIKFVIIISGGVSRYQPMAVAYESPIDCPSLHLIGDGDFNKEYGEELVTKFKEPVTMRHPYGHLIPRLDEAKTSKLRSFLVEMLNPTSPLPSSVESVVTI